MSELASIVDSHLPDLIELRHDLHAHPEIRFKEFETARRILVQLQKIPGLKIRTGIAGTGIVALLGAEKNGPCLALRADMDALPVQEDTGLPYSSRNPGMAHSCGHDGHMTCLVGAARVLSGLTERLKGPVMFIFQPAEESGGGGKILCDEGVLEDPPVKAAFALHAWPTLPLGHVAAKSGASMAATTNLDITLTGRGTHAATPHHGSDPIVAAAQLVLALQTVVSRRLSPTEPGVVTVASISGGTTRNVIPPSVKLSGTIRSTSNEMRQNMIDEVNLIATNIAAAAGVQADINLEPRYPVLYNDASLTDLFQQTAQAELGTQFVHHDEVSLGGEDFAFYGAHTPIVMWRLGIQAPDATEVISLHNPRFNFPDEAIPIGVRMHCAIALNFNR